MGGWSTLLPHYQAAVLTADDQEEDAHDPGSGTKEDPWQLKTAPGTSRRTRCGATTSADPPALVCQVGSTQLKYHAAVDRGPARHGSRIMATGWLSARPTSRRTAKPRHGRGAGAAIANNPVGGWYGLRKGYRGRFGMYLPPLLEALGKAELTHDAKNNRMRAI